MSAAEKELREFEEREIIDLDEHRKILAEIKKLTKYHCVATLKKYLVKILLILSMGRVTGEKDEVLMKRMGESGNERLSIRIKRVRHDLEIKKISA